MNYLKKLNVKHNFFFFNHPSLTSFFYSEIPNIQHFSSNAVKTKEQSVNLIEKLRRTFENDESNGIIVPVFKKSFLHSSHIAIKDSTGEYTYSQLYAASHKLAIQISNISGSGASKHVAFACSRNVLLVIAIWACWISGQIAVPLSSQHPPHILKSLIERSQTKLLITTSEYEPVIKPMVEHHAKLVLLVVDYSFIPQINSLPLLKANSLFQVKDHVVISGTLNNDFYANSSAMLAYSWTSGEIPNSLLLTHQNINKEIRKLSRNWMMDANDCLVYFYPPIHSHTYIFALMCALSNGSKVIMHEHPNGPDLWKALLSVHETKLAGSNIFMASPTTYDGLIDEYNKLFLNDDNMMEYIKDVCKSRYRFMLTGSAVDVCTFNAWRNITTHSILEQQQQLE